MSVGWFHFEAGLRGGSRRCIEDVPSIMDVWIGENYERSADRILILGESWYGDVEPLAAYVPRWARAEITRDYTFARIFNAASGFHTKHATLVQRLAWWNGIAFYNFVPGTVGASADDRPSSAALAAARMPLTAVLAHLAPKGVWIIGKGQAKYSADVVLHFGAQYEVTDHPGARPTSAAMAASWANLLQRLRM